MARPLKPAPSKDAQIHRFRDFVAIYVASGGTEYLKPDEAIALAKALNACARDVKNKPFVESEFRSITITLSEQS